jgi:hypothetical protein
MLVNARHHGGLARDGPTVVQSTSHLKGLAGAMDLPRESHAARGSWSKIWR